LAREVASHLAFIEDEFRRKGMNPEEARLAAKRALGGIEQAKELHRDTRSFVWLDDARRDVGYAFRIAMRAPGFTTIIMLTLALGVGADTAMFSVVHGVLLKSLPYRDSAQLVRVWENVPGAEIGNGKGPNRRLGAMEVRDLIEASTRAKTVTS